MADVTGAQSVKGARGGQRGVWEPDYAEPCKTHRGFGIFPKSNRKPLQYFQQEWDIRFAF